MRTKNAKSISKGESAHMGKVKTSGCAVCGAGIGEDDYMVDAHHTQQGNHFTTIGLCKPCHTGPMGWHGDRTLWRIYKFNENDALNETLRRIYG